MKEILLYQPIFSWTASEFIALMEEHKDEDIVIRVNSPGGDVFSGWGILAKIAEHKGKVTMKLDGHAASMAFWLLLYADEVEGLDISRGMLHRADAYTSNDEQKALLASINADLQKKLEAKVDKSKFKEVTGKTIKDIFAPDQRMDVWFNAKQLKDLGIINKVKSLKRGMTADSDYAFSIAAIDNTHYAKDAEESITPAASTHNNSNHLNQNKMDLKNLTISEIKAQRPELFQQIADEAVKSERNRVKAWLVWMEADPKHVIKQVQEGAEFGMADMSELSQKASAKATLAKVEAGSPGGVETTQVTSSPEQEEMLQFAAQVDEEWANNLKKEALGKTPKPAAQKKEEETKKEAETN